MQTLMKCSIMLHFIWVFTVCQSTRLEVSSTQMSHDMRFPTMWYVPHTMWNQQRFRPVCVYGQTDQSPCLSLKYFVTVKLLTEHHLECLSLKVGCTGSSEAYTCQMPHCWKSHVTAQRVIIILYTYMCV